MIVLLRLQIYTHLREKGPEIFRCNHEFRIDETWVNSGKQPKQKSDNAQPTNAPAARHISNSGSAPENFYKIPATQ